MTPFEHTYITGTASFLPGDPVDNASMDQYIGSINRMSGRIKQRILAENGIRTRHYALDPAGNSLHSVTSMGAEVARRLLANDKPVHFLAAATTGGDCAAPGLANLIQGTLHLPQLETLSVSGICASSMGALNAAAQAVESGAAQTALASEFPSRLFKASRFQDRTADIDFDAHFLRWMLSDGAGGVMLSNQPAASGRSLKIRWVHQKSFSGDLPTCMQVGLSPGNTEPGYLDYPTLADAKRAGAYDLRQNIRLLPNLFDPGLHEYAQMVKAGHLDPARITWFLCHYSSERFKPIMEKLMDEAGMTIPPERWYSNLSSKGNTGAASIFIMLDEFYKTHADRLKPGDQIFGFIPESGQFSVAYFLLEVVDPISLENKPETADNLEFMVPPPMVPEAGMQPPIAAMLKDLMSIWHGLPLGGVPHRTGPFHHGRQRATRRLPGLDGKLDSPGTRRQFEAVKLAADYAPASTRQIVQVAESVATLYLQQWKFLRPPETTS